MDRDAKLSAHGRERLQVRIVDLRPPQSFVPSVPPTMTTRPSIRLVAEADGARNI